MCSLVPLAPGLSYDEGLPLLPYLCGTLTSWPEQISAEDHGFMISLWRVFCARLLPSLERLRRQSS